MPCQTFKFSLQSLFVHFQIYTWLGLTGIYFNLVLKIPHKSFSVYITMFSKVLVKLTGIFLFSSCISATPTTLPGQLEPGENITGNGDIHARAKNPYLCEDPFIWNRRECVPIFGPRAWQDVCVWNSFATFYDYKQGTCPEGTVCLNGINQDGHRFVACVSPETGTGKRQKKKDWSPSRNERR